MNIAEKVKDALAKARRNRLYLESASRDYYEAKRKRTDETLDLIANPIYPIRSFFGR